jgi:hypothetical protein
MRNIIFYSELNNIINKIINAKVKIVLIHFFYGFANIARFYDMVPYITTNLFLLDLLVKFRMCNQAYVLIIFIE